MCHQVIGISNLLEKPSSSRLAFYLVLSSVGEVFALMYLLTSRRCRPVRGKAKFVGGLVRLVTLWSLRLRRNGVSPCAYNPRDKFLMLSESYQLVLLEPWANSLDIWCTR